MSPTTASKKERKKDKCFLCSGPLADCTICSNQTKSPEITENIQKIIKRYQEYMGESNEKLGLDEEMGKERRRTRTKCGLCQKTLCSFPCYDIHRMLVKEKL